MSRSNPTENLQTPVKKYLSWSSKRKQFEYYGEKDSQGNRERIAVEKPIFLVLDTTNSVRGFNNKKPMFSNEVRNVTESPLNVRVKGDDIAEGYWKDIKDTVKAAGGKYCVNVYAGMKNAEGKLEIVMIQFSGALTGVWFEFKKEAGDKAINEMAIKVIGTNHHDDGPIEYWTPELDLQKVSEETNNAAIELDKELQEFLENKLKTKKPSEDEPTSSGSSYNQAEEMEKASEAFAGQPAGDFPDDDDLPF